MESASVSSKREVVIVEGARTPFGSFLGGLKTISATDLAVHASKAAIEKATIDPKDLDQSIFGNVLQTSIDAPYLARHIALKVGMPEHRTALTVNRLCGSGFQSIVSAAFEILLGQAHLVLAGGSENMSQSPFHLTRLRDGYRMGDGLVLDSMQGALTDSYTKLAMGVTAEKLATMYEITRALSDQFALESQQKAAKAQKEKKFEDEIVPIQINHKKQTLTIEQDEHPRAQTTLKSLQALPSVFQGVIHAGSASGIVDGACAVIVSSKYEATRRGLPILGKILSHGTSGCDPRLMGLGPVEACRKALLACGKTLKDMDLIEVNEAFAPQVLAVVKELGIHPDKLNVNGGAIALGHPLGATGTRLVLTALYELRRRNKKYALVSACIGGGQGMAIVLENQSA